MFAIGVDFGTNSVPARVVRCAGGAEFGGAVVGYLSDDKGPLRDESDHHLARQNPGGLGPSVDLSRFMKGPVEIKYAERG